MNIDILEHFKSLFKQSLTFIRLIENGKIPIDRDWTERVFTDEYEYHAFLGGNVGVRLTATDLVIDFDVKNIEDGVDKDAYVHDFLAKYGLESALRVRTASNGYHVYLKKAPDVKISKYNKELWGTAIEFKTAGTQLVAPGSTINGGTYTIDHEGSTGVVCPPELLALIAKVTETKATSGQTIVSPEYLDQLLDCLDPCEFGDSDSWLEVALAAHSASDGQAIDLFVAWSRRDPKYDSDTNEALVRGRWASFSGGGNTNVFKLHQLIKKSGKEVPRLPAEDAFADLDLSDIPQYIQSNEYRGFFQNYKMVEVELTEMELISKLPKLKKKYGVKELTIDEIAEEDRWASKPVALSIDELALRFQEASQGSETFSLLGQIGALRDGDEHHALYGKEQLIQFLDHIRWRDDWLLRNKGTPGIIPMEVMADELAKKHLRKIVGVKYDPCWPMTDDFLYVQDAKIFKNIRTGDHSAFERLTAYFNCATPIDRINLKAFILCMAWNVKGGERPAVIVRSTGKTSQERTQTGKSTLIKLVHRLFTGNKCEILQINPSDKMGSRSIESQLGDLLVKQKRGALIAWIDNARGISDLGTFIEACVTNPTASVSIMYQGTVEINTNFIVAVTSGNPCYSPDFMSRSLIIDLNPHDGKNPNWEREVTAFIDEHRGDILASCLSILAEEPTYEIDEMVSRFPAFQRQVLTKCVDAEGWKTIGPKMKERFDAVRNSNSRSRELIEFEDQLVQDLEANQTISGGESVLSKYESIVVPRAYVYSLIRQHVTDSISRKEPQVFLADLIGTSSLFVDSGVTQQRPAQNQNVVELRGTGKGSIYLRTPKTAAPGSVCSWAGFLSDWSGCKPRKYIQKA